MKVQLLGYNADLYDNETEASSSPHGMVAISLLLQVADLSNIQLRKISRAALKVKYGGENLLKYSSDI